MSNKVPFTKEVETIERILAIVEDSLPLETMRNKAEAAIILLDILSRIPQEKFTNLGDTMAEYNSLTKNSQQMVISGIRANLTMF